MDTPPVDGMLETMAEDGYWIDIFCLPPRRFVVKAKDTIHPETNNFDAVDTDIRKAIFKVYKQYMNRGMGD